LRKGQIVKDIHNWWKFLLWREFLPSTVFYKPDICMYGWVLFHQFSALVMKVVGSSAPESAMNEMKFLRKWMGKGWQTRLEKRK